MKRHVIPIPIPIPTPMYASAQASSVPHFSKTQNVLHESLTAQVRVDGVAARLKNAYPRQAAPGGLVPPEPKFWRRKAEEHPRRVRGESETASSRKNPEEKHRVRWLRRRLNFRSGGTSPPRANFQVRWQCGGKVPSVLACALCWGSGQIGRGKLQNGQYSVTI